jgi:hypothetical protein
VPCFPYECSARPLRLGIPQRLGANKAAPQRFQLLFVSPAVAVLRLDPGALTGPVTLAASFGDDAFEALLTHGGEQGSAIIERLRDEPRAGAKAKLVQQGAALSVRPGDGRFAFESEHVEDDEGEWNRTGATPGPRGSSTRRSARALAMWCAGRQRWRQPWQRGRSSAADRMSWGNSDPRQRDFRARAYSCAHGHGGPIFGLTPIGATSAVGQDTIVNKANPQLIPNRVVTRVTWDSLREDTLGAFMLSEPSHIRIPDPGMYIVGYRSVHLQIDGGGIVAGPPLPAKWETGESISWQGRLNAGQTLSVWVY